MTALTAGSPEYLGARIDGAGVNFCLFSAHAERVVLCVFDEQGEEQQWELPGRSGDRWHGHLAGVAFGCTEIFAWVNSPAASPPRTICSASARRPPR